MSEPVPGASELGPETLAAIAAAPTRLREDLTHFAAGLYGTGAEDLEIAEGVSRWVAEEGLLQPEPEPAVPAPECRRASAWGLAQSAPDFLAAEDTGADFEIDRVLARGSITELFSPRGLGKSHLAHAYAIELARAGKRVLLIDRDNSRREVKRRLRAWGGGKTPTLKVLTRESAPALTDAVAWAEYPIAAYDVLVIDSLDSSTEGVGEGDSAKPAKAIAPLLDIVRRDDGPAALVLGNVIKSGAHSRGCGIVEDRADIVYEVRDATDLQPSGAKPWIEELPAADAGAWAQRSTRRQRRSVYKLALVPTKFRIGEEPEPFIIEVDLTVEPWQLRDVTDAVDLAGAEAREARERERVVKVEAAVAALVGEIGKRAAGGDPMKSSEARTFLRERGLASHAAQEVIGQRDGQSWSLRQMPGRGCPVVLFPIQSGGGSVETADEIGEIERPIDTGTCDTPFLSGPVQQGRTKSAPEKCPEKQGGSEPPISSADRPAQPLPGAAARAAATSELLEDGSGEDDIESVVI